MPALPIARKDMILPRNWVQLQKTMIPDQATASYWSVWYDGVKTEDIGDGWIREDADVGTAWLMWCPFGEDPSVNDSWGHAEEIDESCRNVLTAIESVYGVSFHDSIWVEMGAGEVLPSLAAK